MGRSDDEEKAARDLEVDDAVVGGGGGGRRAEAAIERDDLGPSVCYVHRRRTAAIRNGEMEEGRDLCESARSRRSECTLLGLFFFLHNWDNFSK